ncbi:MAG: XdhC family protein [Peptococcaceae bacterium]|jgi:xanthine dehydrogenase accessory factor|nr:XdhC family protein [Peptococcaceae bacterium]
MKKLFRKMHERLASGESVVLASIVASSGSTPRGSGARMVVCANGESFGTIGGGAVEYESQQLAREVLDNKQSYTKGFSLSPNQVADLGMVCGGDVTVYFQYFSGGNKEQIDLLQKILEILDRNIDSWLITETTDEVAWELAVYVKGEGIIGSDRIQESDIMPLLDRRSVWEVHNGRKYYIEPLVKSGKVCVFGGGHVAQELVPVLAHVGFRCVVIEDRPEFATKSLFPQAEAIYLGDFNHIGASVEIEPNDYVVIMTRGHMYDYKVLAQALRTEALYIGVIGSKKKVAATFKRLVEEDKFSQEDLQRVVTPIGLEIKAETPAEIAISIAAQLIQVRAENR